MHLRSKLLIVSILLCNIAFSQSEEEDASSIVIESITENPDENIDYSEIENELKHKNRININTSTFDLQSLHILNQTQIQAVFRHIKEYGTIKSFYELQTIEGFDTSTIYALLPYIKINENRNHFKYNKTEHSLRTGAVYAESNEEITTDYKGSNIKWNLVYKAEKKGLFTFGFRAEKDAGEKYGLLFNSAFLNIHLNSFCKNILIGDQQISMGQGLLIGSGLGIGKSAMVMHILKIQSATRPHTSMNETGFLRGISARFLINKNIEAILFTGNRRLDATTNTDSNSMQYFGSIISSGYYRTDNEIAKRHSVIQKLSGMHVKYNLRNLLIGLNLLAKSSNISYLENENTIQENLEIQYKQYYKISLDYKWQFRNILLFGEGVYNKGKIPAFLGGLLLAAGKFCDISFLYRHYSVSNDGSMGNAFGDATENRNETGLYSGMVMQINKNIQISLYNDIAKFPYSKYRVNGSSMSNEQLCEIKYSKRNALTFYIRYKQRRKYLNTSEPMQIKIPEEHFKQNLRAHLEYTIAGIRMRNRAEYTIYRIENKTFYGFLMYQDVQFKLLKGLKLNGRISLFESDDYNSRSFAYENTIPGMYSIPSFMGKGFSYYLQVQYHCNKDLQIWLRFADRLFEKTELITKGILKSNETIRKSEIQMQIQWKF